MKLNLILDTNYLLFRNVFVLKKLKRIKQDLKEMLLSDFKKITKAYPFENLYIVSDSKDTSWRKKEYKEYKGKRVKDETIDWNFVFFCYEEFKNEIKGRKNVKFLELSGLEGDDFIAFIIDETNKKGEGNLILSSDKDIQQKLTSSINDKYINFEWNYKFSDERVYLPENYQLIINELEQNVNTDIFEMDNSNEFVTFLDDLIHKTKVKIVSIEEVSFIKLLSGDDGDNIPSCVKLKDGKINPDGRGIGETGAATLYKLFKEIHPNKIDIDSDNFINNLTDVIIYAKKIKDSTAKEIIKNNLIFNRKMMILDTKYMPALVLENMKNHFNNIDNRIITFESLEQIDEDFFNEKKKDIIPERFNQETTESFDPDAFWDL